MYPPRCPICEDIIKDKPVCEKCKKSLNYVGSVRCLKCGKAITDDEREYCGDCQKRKHLFESGVAVFQYDDRIKGSMYRFKYKNRREYATFYAGEIVRLYRKLIEQYGVEAVVPVPMYEKKRRIRGYNQAELLAKELSKLLKIPMIDNFLIRSKMTIPQKELSDTQRINNVKNAFQIRDIGVKYNKILLVDDIYTTGITLDECTKALKAFVVKEVYFAVVCIGKGS